MDLHQVTCLPGAAVSGQVHDRVGLNKGSEHVRTLIRQARKDAQGVSERPGEALRHGKAYREIFQLVRAEMNRDCTDEPSASDDHHE